MLHELLTLHRDEIVSRTREKVALRTAPRPTPSELEHGVPLFLTQLAETLRAEQASENRSTTADMARAAALHGDELRRAGFTVAQVVHDYGDVCQAVTELAIEREVPISADEFRTLNRCLDVAIAQAVTEYARQREIVLADQVTERLGVFAHELRNLVSNATLAFTALKGGSVGLGGSTAKIVDRSLVALGNLIDRSLAEVRLEAGLHRCALVPLDELMEEVEAAAAIEAGARGVALTVTSVERSVTLNVDRQLIAAALANLLQNAFKFTKAGGHVVLRTEAAAVSGRVLIEVEDECGGLPPGGVEGLFRPFEQRSTDRSGLGLGLAIARESVESNGGSVRARNLPGKGCVFTVELSRAPVMAGGPVVA